MGFLSRFEGKMEDTVEGAAEKMGASPISPVQIAKKAEKQMRRNKMVGAGKQYAPTLYTVLVSQADDARLFGYYPTLAGETETYLAAKAAESGLAMDGQPLVRFIADEDLKHGKFEVIAEMVAAPMIAQLRQEEMERYGIAAPRGAYANRGLQNRRPAPEAVRGGYDPYAPQPRDDRYAHDASYGAGYDAGYDEDVLHQHPHAGIDAATAASLGAAGAVGAAGAASGYDDFSAQEPKTMVFGQAGAAAMADPAPAQDLQAAPSRSRGIP